MVLQIISFFVFFVVPGKTYNLDTQNALIYSLPKNDDRSSYFGMAVALRPKSLNLKDSWILQVGAPRGNISRLNIKEPGAVYRCHLHGPCNLFIVDRNGNVPGINYVYNYKDRKDEGWTGVTMDIKSSDNRTKTTICGSRWSNQNLTNDDNIGVTYLMTGVCYLQDVCDCLEDYPTHKLLPLVNSGKIYYPKPYAYDKSFYYWGLGQAGISSALLDDLSAIIIGAPGYNNWLGSVIYYDTDVEKNFYFRVGRFEDTKEFKRNSYPYIGYQVSFGRFFSDKKLWLLTGAPRADNYHGKVIVFQFKEFQDSVHIASELVGSTFGEYFGSSITVSDVNSDGFDDVIVGAPLFSRRHPEEGRIYVYLGNSRGNFMFRSQVINGRSGYSRFGTSTASLGDLDQDGYNDIAVGAPYEQDGTGAVYIFRGSKKGLIIEYVQRILAQQVHHGLRGFGISISQGVDIDGNRYNDVAIGAYLSDEVVLLRSRPIIHLHSVIRLEDFSLLDRKASSFNISICSKYSGSNAPHSIKFLRTIEVDVSLNRVFLMDNKTSVEKKNIDLLANEIKCEVLPIFVKSDSSNYKPIQITLKSELPLCQPNKISALNVWDGDSETKDGFLKGCPIGKKKETSIDVPFAGECGADNVCQAELVLTCETPLIQKNSYLVVTNQFITLSLELKNTGEPAHNTFIIIDSNMDLIIDEYEDGHKMQIPKRRFHIDVATNFIKHFQKNIYFTIATDLLHQNKTAEMRPDHLNLKVVTHTKSQEDFLDDNVCDMNFNLLSDSIVDLYSFASSASTFDIKNSKDLNFTLYYEVQEKGNTPVSDAELTICIPSYFKNSEEIEFSTVTVETSDWMYSLINYQEYKEESGPSEIDIKWDNLNSSDSSLPVERTLFLNCSAINIRCKTISVVFQNGIRSQISSYVKIFVTLNLTNIGAFIGEKDIVHFTSSGILEFKKLFKTQSMQIFSQSSATFYREEEAKSVETYIIALSVVAGALLLLLITTALVKSEFFRRKKKEELEALKSEELRRQFPPKIIGETEIPLQE